MTLKRFVKSDGAERPQELAAGKEAQKMRLLYVEDEEPNWHVVRSTLAPFYALERATDARSAFAMLSRSTFDAILMDIQLANSELDGIGVTQVLRGTHRGKLPDYARDVLASKIPIIFVSAYTARYTRKELISLGGDGLVAKPVDFTLLALCLSRVLLRGLKT